MPLLAYCMMEADAAVTSPVAGVGGAPVETLVDSGLRCFYSRFEGAEPVSSGPPAVETALAFHEVLQELFRQAAIIPFRFPTMVGGEAELVEYLRTHAQEHGPALARVREMVQMEIRISERPEPGAAATDVSGGEYLRGRQARTARLKAAVEKCRDATKPWIAGWRERETPAGIRCCVLVRRA